MIWLPKESKYSWRCHSVSTTYYYAIVKKFVILVPLQEENVCIRLDQVIVIMYLTHILDIASFSPGIKSGFTIP